MHALSPSQDKALTPLRILKPGPAWPGRFQKRNRCAAASTPTFAARSSRRSVGSRRGRSHEPAPAVVSVESARAKAEPMVRGLFARADLGVVLAAFEESVVYVTSDTIEPLLLNHRWERSA